MKLSSFHRKVWHRHLRRRPQSPPAITWQDSRWWLYCVGVISVQSAFHDAYPHIPIWLRNLMNGSPRCKVVFRMFCARHVQVMKAPTYATTRHPTVATAATNPLDFSRKVASSGVHPAAVTDAIHAHRQKLSSQMPHGAMCTKKPLYILTKKEHETLYSQALPMFFNAQYI